MNVLFLSHLSGAAYAGPTYSVPKQIEAQSKLDNVFWYNAVKSSKSEWKQLSYYHDLNEYSDELISSLPEPFNKPDIIIVELFYNMMKSPLLKELIICHVPYVIIPRGELTAQGQARKALKKKIANLLICKRYAKKAAAIQFLTEQELIDSGSSWNEHYIVIPNGIDFPVKGKGDYSTNGIKCVSIGRIEPYQKGLDLLIEACAKIKKILIEANCRIIICGPDKEDKLRDLKKAVIQNTMEEIISFSDGVFGKEKEQLLLSNDVFLIPSRFEGHPMALIEALSYGLPAVVTTGSNMRKEIEEYDAGWTADNSVESLREALLKMINEKNMDKKGQRARKLAEKYKWTKLAFRAHEEYTKIIGELE